MKTSQCSQPRILFVGWHSCIRLVKEAMALKKAGYEVHLLTHAIPTAWNCFDSVTVYYDDTQFCKHLEKVKDEYDIYHVHNEPNSIVVQTIEHVKGTVIFDAHDYDLLRVPGCQDDEILSVLYCDGMINVSQGIDGYIREVFNLDRLGTPSEVIYSWCLEEHLQPDYGHIRKGIVYEGGYRTPETMGIFTYRNLFPIVYHLIDQGYEFNLYGNVPDEIRARYNEIGAKAHVAVFYHELLRTLPQYKWGWSGFLNEPRKNHIQWAMTNKLFEYLACGLPVLTFQTEEQNAFVTENEVGIAI